MNPESRPLDLPQVFDADVAATFLGRSAESIKALAKRGELPAKRIGGRFVFERESFLAAVKPVPKPIGEEARL